MHSWILTISRHTPDKMGKTVLLLLTEGAEEMEAVITIDVLRRAGVRLSR